MFYFWILILTIQIISCTDSQTQISNRITGTFRGTALRIKWNSEKRLIFNLTKIENKSKKQSLLIIIENYNFQDQLRAKIYVHSNIPNYNNYDLVPLQNNYKFKKDYVIIMYFVGNEVNFKFGNITKKTETKYDFPSKDSNKNYPKFIGHGISEIQYKDNINDPMWKTLEPECTSLEISEDKLRQLYKYETDNSKCQNDLINETKQNEILMNKSIADNEIFKKYKIQSNREKEECVKQLNNKTEQFQITQKENLENETFRNNSNIKVNKTIQRISIQTCNYSPGHVTSIIINIIFLVLIFIGIFVIYFKWIKKYYAPYIIYYNEMHNKTKKLSKSDNLDDESHSNLLDKNETNVVNPVYEPVNNPVNKQVNNPVNEPVNEPKIDVKKTTVYIRNILDLPSCAPFNLNYNYGEITMDQLKQDIAENINGNVEDILLWINKQILTDNNLFSFNIEHLDVDFVEVKEFEGFTNKKCITIRKLGVVYYKELPCGTKVAAKYFQNVIKDKKEEDIRHIMTEMKILIMIGNNENIAKFHSFTRIKHDSLIISNIFVGGKLNDYIMEKIKLDYGEIKLFLQQILAGLSYIHQKRVIHLDINCDNMLMNYVDKVIKLSEFGASVILDEGCDFGTEKVNSTPKLMAPELLEGEDRKYTTKADIWSLGCSIIQMVTGQLPFSGLSDTAAALRIYQTKSVEYDNTQVSDYIQELIYKCTRPDPNSRPDATQLLQLLK